MNMPDTPLSEEAAALLNLLKPKIKDRLTEIKKLPIAVLLWGPEIIPNNPLADVRQNLCVKLREEGHAAVYSEEICDHNSAYSIRLQQLAQAQEFDLIVSMPGSHGAIGEIHDFAADKRVNAKLLVFLNEQHLSGYSPQSLKAIETILSCHLEYYPSENQTEIIERRTLEEAQKIRELKYILAGRYL